MAVLSPAAERRAASLIYAASFSYTISLGSMQVLVPLYGLYLGYDIKALGLILSSSDSTGDVQVYVLGRHSGLRNTHQP
jgi:hypothetical protein